MQFELYEKLVGSLTQQYLLALAGGFLIWGRGASVKQLETRACFKQAVVPRQDSKRAHAFQAPLVSAQDVVTRH